ncbi:hypothetical protein F511_13031 [Dorcoceras hygrometricum]|uniref:Uncharacterized protein n=1 Tax=Dorcoceras hygrometricum TaxID=472368 RepID=A0A2Z7AAL7_9LAMI|nr:hypothetical protein F511_13031 [Dorcoceras hygrometricum]
MAGAPPVGPPPGPTGPNLTDHAQTVDQPGRTDRGKLTHQPCSAMRHPRPLRLYLVHSTT